MRSKFFNKETEKALQEFMMKHETNKLYCRVIMMMALGPFATFKVDPMLMLQLLLEREICVTK